MSGKNTPASDNKQPSQTVAEKILESFYSKLEKKDGYSDIANRFRDEAGRSEKAIRDVLFGSDS